MGHYREGGPVFVFTARPRRLEEIHLAGGTKDHHRNAAPKPSMNSSPFWSKLRMLLGILKRRDSDSIFLKLVDPEEVENYYDVIKEPMDFGTITAKLNAGSYKTLEEFENKVNSIGYAESLMQFAKDLGPTANAVARRKLENNAKAPKLHLILVED